ncbi:MAG: hypothetical protein ACE5SW_11590 [Nitrososphaeraceae archaeon]
MNLKDETIKELQSKFGSIRKKFNIYIKNPSIFAIIQDNPCLVKCVHELRNKNEMIFDSFYNAKHNWIKKKLIDAILDEFGNRIEVRSEYSISNGKLDILILQTQNNKIHIKYKTKTIAIEIKSGKTIDSKIFCQIERYLADINVLIMVRVPTQDVVPIHSNLIINELIEDISLLNRKVDKILSNSIIKVQGDWCRECNADCEFKKSPKWNSIPTGSFEGFEGDLKSVNLVIAKVIILIKQMLEEFQKST